MMGYINNLCDYKPRRCEPECLDTSGHKYTETCQHAELTNWYLIVYEAHDVFVSDWGVFTYQGAILMGMTRHVSLDPALCVCFLPSVLVLEKHTNICLRL